MTSACLALIKFYQIWIGPWLGSGCRFVPSCSCYAHQAFSRFHPVQATWLVIRRLSRCRPGGGAGWDPVPTQPLGARDE